MSTFPSAIHNIKKDSLGLCAIFFRASRQQASDDCARCAVREKKLESIKAKSSLNTCFQEMLQKMNF